MLRFLCVGKWSEAQVDVRSVASGRVLLPQVEQAIQTAWATATARPGVHLFDGPMCRLESWEATEQNLQLRISTTGYRMFMGTNMSHPEFAFEFGRDVMANPVGMSPALLTCDNQLLLGRRNSTVAYYPERVHPFSGSLEPADENLFSAVARELAEELSIDRADLTQMYCTGIVEDQNLLQPELIFSVKTTRSAREVESLLDATEHRSMLCIGADAESIENALNNPELTPVATGTLLLWGRCNIGQAWFNKVSVR